MRRMKNARVLDEFIGIQKRIAVLEKEKNEQEIRYRKSKSAYEQVEQTWLSNQAAMLAESLNDGDACPVCGSEHHPLKRIQQLK